MKTNIHPIIVDRSIDHNFVYRANLKRNKAGFFVTRDLVSGKKHKTMTIMFSPEFDGSDGINMYNASITDQQDHTILVGVAEEDLHILHQLMEWINSGRLDCFCFPQDEKPVATVAINESNSN